MQQQSDSQRVAIFGDLSGYVDPFERSLRRLGVDTDNGRIPMDLTIVSVGDVVHKGPDSDDAVALIDYLMKNNPGQMVVLAGDHEAHHLGGPRIGARPNGPPACNCSHETVQTLTRWRRDGKLLVAAAVGPDRDTLVTHAGLGKPAWEQLGRPATATEAASKLNEQLRTDARRAFRAGRMLKSRQPAGAPGVVWAHGPQEVYETWKSSEAPFHQVHGHVGVYYWAGKQWGHGMSAELQAVAHADPAKRRTLTQVGGKDFVGIDPGFTANPASVTHEMTPLVVKGLTLDVPPPSLNVSFR